jgi:hypothetical protein
MSIIILLSSIILLSGCSISNPQVSKKKIKTEVENSKTVIETEDNSILVKNSLDLSETFKVRECGEKRVYAGFGTIYLMNMFGMDAYNLKGEKLDFNPVLSWIAAPVALPIMAGFEILFLQPLYQYPKVHACNKSTDTQERVAQNTGYFTCTVIIQTTEGEHKKFEYKSELLPLSLPLENQNDMLAVTKSSVDTSNGFIVNIDGIYEVDGTKVKVKEEKRF